MLSYSLAITIKPNGIIFKIYEFSCTKVGAIWNDICDFDNSEVREADNLTAICEPIV
jgi:hypothetical protein